MVPTLFSVSYAGLWGQHHLDLPSFLKKAAALGYPAVELMGKRPHLSPLDVDDKAADEIRRTAERVGIEIVTIAGYTNFTLGRDSEVPSTEIQIAYVRRLAQLAHKLGAKIVRVFTGYATEPEGYGHDWDVSVRAIRECAQAVADCGVLLGVQNHHDVGVGVDAFAEFLDDVGHPCCRAMFDPWAAALHGEDLHACARRLAPRMVQTTLADYIRLPRYAYQPGLVNYHRQDDMIRAVPLGHGFVDLDAFFAGLRDGGFEGYVAYEMCSPLRGGPTEENLDRTARVALEQINRLIGRAEREKML